MKHFASIFGSLVLAGLVAWSAPATAGIIVTVGKLPSMSEGDGTKTGDATRRPTNCDPSKTATAGVDSTSASKPGTTTSKTSTSGCGCPTPSSPTSGSSDWYDTTRCVPLGGGLLYCDDPAMGAGPGDGEGGFYEDDELASPDGSDEVVALGCTGGGGAAPVGLGLLVLVGFAVTRRRRDSVTA